MEYSREVIFMIMEKYTLVTISGKKKRIEKRENIFLENFAVLGRLILASDGSKQRIQTINGNILHCTKAAWNAEGELLKQISKRNRV